jgi:hypothetical protein
LEEKWNSGSREDTRCGRMLNGKKHWRALWEDRRVYIAISYQT